MILPKTPISDIDLDELERKLRAFDPSCAKTSTRVASGYPLNESDRSVCRRNASEQKSGRSDLREAPAPAPVSAVRLRQKLSKGSAHTNKMNIDDVERQLREVASSVRRKALQRSDALIERDKQSSETLNPQINAGAKAPQAGGSPQLGPAHAAGWRAAIHLRRYSEQSVVSRCAHSLALPLLLLSLGAGALVVLSPKGLLNTIDGSLENALSPYVVHNDPMPSAGVVAAAASSGQTGRSIALAEQSAIAVASSDNALAAEAGPVNPTQSAKSASSSDAGSAVSSFDAAVIPVSGAGDDQRPSQPALDPTSDSRARPSMEGGDAPAVQADVIQTTGAPLSGAPPRSAALSGEVLSEPPPQVLADLLAPQPTTSLPMFAPSPPSPAALASLGIKSSDTQPGSGFDAVSGTPAALLAALAIPEATSSAAATPLPGSENAAAARTESDAGPPVLAPTPLPAPPDVATPSGVSRPADSRPDAFDEASVEAPSSATTGLEPIEASASPNSGSAAPGRAAPSEAQSIASEQSVDSAPSPAGETVLENAASFPAQEAPAAPAPLVAPLREIVAQATPDIPAEQAKASGAQLVVAQAPSAAASGAVLLPVSLDSAPAGAVIIINGLAAGTTLSAGRALDKGGWRLSANELHGALLRPPQGFTGAMDLGLELRLSNDAVADRKTLHLEWTATAASQTTKPAFVVRRLDPDEVAALLGRGEGFIASGDLASARLLLQRAAEAGEAQAALSLAGTFDPMVLAKLGLQGQKADIEKARTWYERARELGSTAAPRRLQLLAGYDE